MSNIFYDYLMLPFLRIVIKSAGPAKESKAEKRKKEKKGAKGWGGGGGANRPVSGKPGKKDVQTNKDQVEMSKQNNLSPEQGRMQLNQENNVQSTEGIDKSEGNEGNFTAKIQAIVEKQELMKTIKKTWLLITRQRIKKKRTCWINLLKN